MIPRGATYQGRPCKHGHDGLRYLKNHTCVPCAREAASRQVAARREQRVHDYLSTPTIEDCANLKVSA